MHLENRTTVPCPQGKSRSLIPLTDKHYCHSLQHGWQSVKYSIIRLHRFAFFTSFLGGLDMVVASLEHLTLQKIAKDFKIWCADVTEDFNRCLYVLGPFDGFSEYTILH